MTSPTPHKPPGPKGVQFPKLGPGSRPGSPSKPASPHKTQPPSRVPSSSSFNPAISSASHPRWPRKDESMLSVNGSPLANPYQLGMGFAGWLSAVPELRLDGETAGGNGKNPQRAHKRTNSIIVRSTSGSTNHTRNNSQAALATSSQASHSRSNSQTTSGFVPNRTKSPQEDQPKTPARPTISLSTPAAMVAVPTKDGHVLEFDPLHTTPAEIDALEGITDSAKKQARADIARLVMQAVELWKIA